MQKMQHGFEVAVAKAMMMAEQVARSYNVGPFKDIWNSLPVIVLVRINLSNE